MGYTTNFSGAFQLDRKLTVTELETLSNLADWNAQSPGIGEPDSFCQWIVGSDGQSIEHNDDEKFYYHEEWLDYLIDNYFKPWGVTMSGNVIWTGENAGDSGVLFAKDNMVKAVQVEEMPEPNWDEVAEEYARAEKTS